MPNKRIVGHIATRIITDRVNGPDGPVVVRCNHCYQTDADSRWVYTPCGKCVGEVRDAETSKVRRRDLALDSQRKVAAYDRLEEWLRTMESHKLKNVAVFEVRRAFDGD